MLFNINVLIVQVRAGLDEVPLNFGTEQINLNTICGTYVENAFIINENVNAPGSSFGGSDGENSLRLVRLIFLNLFTRITY